MYSICVKVRKRVNGCHREFVFGINTLILYIRTQRCEKKNGKALCDRESNGGHGREENGNNHL